MMNVGFNPTCQVSFGKQNPKGRRSADEQKLFEYCNYEPPPQQPWEPQHPHYADVPAGHQPPSKVATSGRSGLMGILARRDRKK